MKTNLVRTLALIVATFAFAGLLLGSPTALASNITFAGNGGYNYSGNVVVLTANRVQNNDIAGHSGTLRLELWAFPSAYSGSAEIGYKLAQYTLGTLNAGFGFPNVNTGPIPFGYPPNGVWIFTLLVTEYTAGPVDDGYTVRDWINFSNPVTIGPPPGQLQLPPSITFANQTVGTQGSPLVGTITNIGGSPVTISNVAGTDTTEFPATTTCFTTLQPGGQCTITMSFAPSTTGPHSSTVTFFSDGLGSPQSFTASGTGMPALGQLQVPSSISFGNQQVGTQSAAQVFSITNIGGSAVTISNVTGSDLTEFPGNTTCFTTLQPAASCNLTVSFAPSSAGLHSETIVVTSTGLGSPQSFTVSGTGTTSSGSANTPGPLSGLWWNSNESGWGIHFTQRGSNTFAAWYTYDTSGNPKWYVSTCTGASGTSGTCSGTLYQVSGPTFFGTTFNPNLVNAVNAGTLQVNFQNTSAATMTYSGVSGQTRTVSITRQPLANGAVPGVDYTDIWWGGQSESGWGMAITQQASTVFLAWYVYDNAGKPMWYVATCTLSGTTCGGSLLRTTGPAFGPSFNSNQVQSFTVGTVSVNFTDGNNATLTYTVNGVSGSKNITRQLF